MARSPATGTRCSLLLFAWMGLLVCVLGSDEDEVVTCGSVAKLRHVESDYYLHSHQINWGTGSSQQSVTAHGSKDDQGGMWLVKEGHGLPLCATGTPIACGDIIRLEHLSTRKNLHSHLFRAALSNQQEASCFGDHGYGDTGDNWKVECDPGAQYWSRKDSIRLVHKDTGKFLSTSANFKFNQQNCPNCPILGQQEVSAAPRADRGSKWITAEGVYIQAKH